jgi:hypothetical protein
MSRISDDDLAELVEGIDTYLVTCIQTFNVDPIQLMAVLMSRMVQLAQTVGGENVFLALLKCAEETIINSPDIDKPMRH